MNNAGPGDFISEDSNIYPSRADLCQARPGAPSVDSYADDRIFPEKKSCSSCIVSQVWPRISEY